MLSKGNPQASRHAVRQIWLHFYRVQVKLFSTRQNANRLLWFASGGSDNPPLGVDTLAHPWPDMRLYGFPPVPLIPHVLSRIMEQRRELLLVAESGQNLRWSLCGHHDPVC